MQKASNINCYNHKTPKHHYNNLALLVHTHDKSMQTHCNSQYNTTIQPHTKQCQSKKVDFWKEFACILQGVLLRLHKCVIKGVLHVLVDRNLRDMHHFFLKFQFLVIFKIWEFEISNIMCICILNQLTKHVADHMSINHSMLVLCVCVLGCSCCFCLLLCDVLLSL